MIHSVRLRLVDWFKLAGDHVAKHLVQKLRGAEMHAQSGANDGNRFIVGIGNAGCEGQANDPVPVGRLGDQVCKMDLNALIANQQSIGAYGQFPLSHQILPQYENYDTSKLNAHALGVQP